MAGPSFGFKWTPINADIDWQLTQSKSYGDGIKTINEAVNAFADATPKVWAYMFLNKSPNIIVSPFCHKAFKAWQL